MSDNILKPILARDPDEKEFHQALEEFLATKARIWTRYRDAGILVIDAGHSRWMSLIHGSEVPDQTEFELKNLWNTDYCCLPCSTNLTQEDQDKVIKCLAS